jgi:hypothetical protein
VATQPYKITFTDGTVQELPKVYRQYTDKDWLVFQDEAAEVLRVKAKDVKSVVRSDQPNEKPPEIIIG